MKKTIVLLLFTVLALAQVRPRTTEAFVDSKTHWYNFTNNSAIIRPVINQKNWDDEDIMEIADNILVFQRNNGGWMKNYDVTIKLTQAQIDTLTVTKPQNNTTFDNGTTYSHIEYLSTVYALTSENKYKDASISGLNFILEAQYVNGGWSQYYPHQPNYSKYITFNDGATIGIMNLFKDILDNKPEYSYIDATLKGRIHLAYDKGLNCLLTTQLKGGGKLTVWSQQYDEVTLLPTWGRSYEPPSFCNNESCDIVLFLMDIKNPSTAVKNAVKGAVNWFKETAIDSTKVETFKATPITSQWTTHPITVDRRIITNAKAQTIWSRFYEFGTKKPLFCDRDGSFSYALSNLNRERRVGYSWYTYKPTKVLKTYDIWKLTNN